MTKTDNNTRQDYNPNPIKRTLKWNDLSIGIQHNEGDRRFLMSAPLHNVSYGCVMGSYGSGEDGKSIDVYIGKNLESDRVYRIAQLDNFGNLDETKWAIGFNTIDEAEQAYRLNVPWKYYGGIQESSVDEFRKACLEPESYGNGSRSKKPMAIKNSSVGVSPGGVDELLGELDNRGSDGGGFRIGGSDRGVDVEADLRLSTIAPKTRNINPQSKSLYIADSSVHNASFESDANEARTDAYHRGLFDFDSYNLDESTKVQSILFEKSKWTLAQAVQWTKKHKFNIVKADPESEDAQYIHVRVLNPSVCKGKERTIEFSKPKGIIARVCIP